MKILQLRFKNLNSLYGEWLIDFSTPEYSSNGIFAITGPTGAGKSTILDAMCLALYGATPRLGKITKSSNQLMSQQTAECFAEVTFASQQGTYTCHWSQNRARKKSDGTLGESRHEIIDTLTGHIIESKKREVAHVIEAKTGMDFERFTRSILLAQGGFAAFLTASPDERAPILEQITGTEIYSELSKRVHEQTRREKEKLHLMQIELSGITLLNKEQEEEYMAEILEKKQQESELIKEHQQLDTAINWLITIESLNKELAELSAEAEDLNEDLKSFEFDRNRLIHANKAIELDGEYATLKELRKQHINDNEALAKEELKIPELHRDIEQQKAHLIIAEHALTASKMEEKKLGELTKKVRHLDHQLVDKKQIIEIYQNDIAKKDAEINTKSEELNSKRKLLAKIKEKQDDINHYLKSHQVDAELISQLTGIEEQLNTLIALQSALKEKTIATLTFENKLIADQSALERYIEQEHIHRSHLLDIEHQINKENCQLNQLLGERLLREYRTEKESLLREMAFLHKIASLESERHKLEDNKPCPLCGSKDHPYAKNTLPQLSETESLLESITQLIENAENIEQNIQKLKASREELNQKSFDVSNQKLCALHEKNQTEISLIDGTKHILRITTELNSQEQSALNKLKKFDIDNTSQTNAEHILNVLKLRLKNWHMNQEKSSHLEQEYVRINNEIKPLEAVIALLNTSLSEKKLNLELNNHDYQQLQTVRCELFGIKNPDEEEKKREHFIQEAEKAKKLASNELDNITRSFETIQTKIHTLKEQIAQRATQLNESEYNFKKTLDRFKFNEEAIFLSCCLPSEQRTTLTEQAKLLDTRKTSLDAKISDKSERLITEKNKMITESDLSTLKLIMEQSHQDLNQIRERTTTLTIELNKHNENMKLSEIKIILIEKQQLESNRFEKIHSLIGSSDGKKFRNFAQGLTFELMVNHANKQLEKMTDRYLLIRDDIQPLELNVIDNYQAGDIRTTKNLSGGESFIVSLSLALGLSKMASKKVRVDSLFLDEGFGTLDDNALETALETLNELQQDGKIIGVISHVHALKERISTQINVQSDNNGKSSISGPGCQKIENKICR